MSSTKYLLNIAYMGNSFRGAQRQVRGALPRLDDPLTIQGRLEMALKELNPCNEPIVKLSSRTDSGVHAFNSTCQVYLKRKRYNDSVYDTTYVTKSLNRHFNKASVPIRILKTFIVPENFDCCRNVISRTYLYRIMISKSNAINAANHHYIPIEEWERCLFYCTSSFNLELMEECGKLLEGYHDFRSFMKKHHGDEEKITKKVIDYIKIEKRNIIGYSSYSWPNFVDSNKNEYLFLDIYIKSEGFLYRQVRRTVAALIAVAQGKVTIRDIKFMLEVPSHRSWCPLIKTLPAHGLYLCEVQYAKEDLDTFRSDPDSP